MDLRDNSTINIFDLTIPYIHNKNYSAIFRRPSHTDITVNNTSSHPFKHKLAADGIMIHRLTHVS